MATPESRPKFSSSFFDRLVSNLCIPLDEHPSESGFLPLLLVSCAALYIEVLLIRWIGTELRIFAYFQNLTLIAAFLGFGVGCYNAGKKKLHLFDAISLGILVVIATLPIPKWRDILEVISMGMAFSSDAAIWTKGLDQYHLSAILAIFLLSSCVVTIFLLLLTSVMMPLGQWVGTYLNSAKNPVRAYTANLTGSLIGSGSLPGWRICIFLQLSGSVLLCSCT